ncbi:autoinducer binding domain-containing protein (plasmid) [Mesorhizobium sp. AR07]|uniref:autoinducer binding domain-containing protein n=1 Tax=Mesorhizobium sp. AR07 TaxID=2865838 RepID=UPI002160CD9D|nr:autoinducer binding domain-containing protein [Mesorhizobium sp. AR07]UVK48269.1 autoinducer binding domain-containing protein [Mesorhizobium sp. AR07]
MAKDPKRQLDEHIRTLIDALEVGYDERIRFALESFALDSGFERFAFLHARGPDSRAFSNYPEEWQRRYLTKNYAALDPVVAHAKRTMQISWSGRKMSNLSREERQFFAEAEEFGIAAGLTMPIKTGFGALPC